MSVGVVWNCGWLFAALVCLLPLQQCTGNVLMDEGKKLDVYPRESRAFLAIGADDDSDDTDAVEKRLEVKRLDGSLATAAVPADILPENLGSVLNIKYVMVPIKRPIMTSFTPRIGRRKKSAAFDDDPADLSDHTLMMSLLQNPLEYLDLEGMDRSDDDSLFQRLLHHLRQTQRVGRAGEDPFDHLRASFIPRLGKKRAGGNNELGKRNSDDTSDQASVAPRDSRSQHVINLSAGSALTPRIGRSTRSVREFKRSAQ